MTTHKVLFAIGLFYIAVSISVLGLASTGFGANVNVLDLLLGSNSTPVGVETNVQGQANLVNSNSDGNSPAFLGLMVENGVSGTITSTNTLTGGLKVASVIAKYFGVPISDVLKLKDGGMGYGEIFKLYEIHLESGKTISDIMALRNSGMGWGQINHQLGLDPGNHGKNLGSAVSGHVTQSVTTTLTTTIQLNNGQGKGNQDGNTGKPTDKGNGNGNNNGNNGKSGSPPGKNKP